MCYITGDLLAADLSLRLPRYLFSTPPLVCLSSPSINSQPNFPDRRSNGADQKGQRALMYRRTSHFALSLPFIFMYIVQTYVSSWWARGARRCITKAKSGLMGVREEQMCWMGFTSGNKSHFYHVLYLDPGPLVLLFLHCPCSKYISIDPPFWYQLCDSTFTSASSFSSLPLHVIFSPEQFTNSLALGWLMDE